MKTSKLEILNVLIGNLDGKNYAGSGDNAVKCAIKYVDGTMSSSDYDKLTLEYAPSKSIDLSLFRAEYDKKIYAPGRVELCFNMNGNIDEKTLPGILRTMFKSVKVNLYGADDTYKPVSLAQNYYIHSISQKRASVEAVSSDKKSIVINTQKQLTILCYSPDNRMTINKYCNVYVKKKFYEDVLNKDIPKIFSGKNIELNKQEYCHLEVTKKDNKKEELIQPFLVQYNESFYDFMVRVASRCGEFLYYENGKLNFGLPADTKNQTNQKKFEGITLSDYSDIYIDFESEGINRNDIGSYAFDYTQKKGNNTSGTYRVDTMVGADDYLRRTVEGDGPGFNEIMDTWEIVSCFGAGFTGEQIEESLTNMVNDAGTNVAQSLIAHTIAKDDFKRGYVNDNDKNSFGTLDLTDPTKNLNNAFYHKIQKGVAAVTEGVLNVDTEDHLQNFTLGCGINTGDTLHKKGYIVTRMHGTIESKIKKTKGEDEKHKIVDVYSDSTVRRNWVEATPIYYVEKTDKTNEIIDFFPPECGISPIRKAEPQVGIVTAADDPLRLGRVRVDFAWQKDNMDAEANEGKISAANSSPWIRVAVPYSGGSTDGGMNVTLEKGENVMLNFIGGNIECPYVEGALFTKNNKPNLGWVELKSKYFVPKYTPRVIASSSGHSISFIDGKNSSAFTAGICPPIGQVWSLVKGARGVVEKYSKNANKWDFQGDRPDLYGGIVLRDSLGIYEIEASTHKRSISINSPIGKVDINAFTGITISAPNGDVKIKGKNVSIEAGNNVTITSGKNIRGEKYTADTVYAALGSTLGGILANVITGTSKDLLGFDPNKVTDVAFIRSCWEVIMRPVEGSLKLGSKRHVMMTAGKGKVSPPANIAVAPALKVMKNKDENDYKFLRNNGQTAPTFLISQVGQIKDAVYIFYRELCSDVEAIDKKAKALLDKKIKINAKIQASKQNYDFWANAKALKEFPDVRGIFNGSAQNNGKVFDKDCKDFVNLYNKFVGLIENFKKTYTKDKLFSRVETFIRGVSSSGNIKNVLDKKYTGLDDNLSFLNLVYSANPNSVTCNVNERFTSPDKLPKILSRNIIYTYVKYCALQKGSGFSISWSGNQSDNLKVDRITKTVTLREYSNMEGNPADTNIDHDEVWKAFCNAITVNATTDSAKRGAFGAALSSAMAGLAGGALGYDDSKGLQTFDSFQKLININGVSGPRAMWDPGNGGTVMISSSDKKMNRLKLDGSGFIDVDNYNPRALGDYLKDLYNY